ncbi:tRNA (cytidine(34)-2'-O)-methyltransferase [Helicobacter sp. 11S02629-2]|uniref:tRNA (cytidine(34)-2'-O)-methyltransferase n=1 Tax=Helicobacter sp. 11S02629-2 TaxID=1476195 RepID=UPI000BA65511|nr:tRNA (cytidine(34)-2'-O)-methyltransferase [Helicobacter sp. 11S02629-2]PAF45522.1 hypothetical protein BKH40_03415 [Helicobacter sp. 11S02629-2]
MSLHIVLHSPQIPPNTGNIARLSIALDATLHLVKPLGFDISDARVKRSGLDYWDILKLEVHENLESFLNLPLKECFHMALSSKVTKPYYKESYLDVKKASKDVYLHFGAEDKGFEEAFYKSYLSSNLATIPMHKNCRCLNLSNAVAVVAYDYYTKMLEMDV